MDFSLSPGLPFPQSLPSFTCSPDPRPSSIVHRPSSSALLPSPPGRPGNNFLLAGPLIGGDHDEPDCMAAGLTAAHRYAFVSQGGAGAPIGEAACTSPCSSTGWQECMPPAGRDARCRCGEGGFCQAARRVAARTPWRGSLCWSQRAAANQDERRLATRPGWCEGGGGWWVVVVRRAREVLRGRREERGQPALWLHRILVGRGPIGIAGQRCSAVLSLSLLYRYEVCMCRYVQDREMDSLARAPSRVWSAGLQRRIFVTRSL